MGVLVDDHPSPAGTSNFRTRITVASSGSRAMLKPRSRHMSNNDFIGSLEGSVMPRARRFNELEVEGTSTEIAALPPVELEPRALRPDRDIVASLPPAIAPEAA